MDGSAHILIIGVLKYSRYAGCVQIKRIPLKVKHISSSAQCVISHKNRCHTAALRPDSSNVQTEHFWGKQWREIIS